MQIKGKTTLVHEMRQRFLSVFFCALRSIGKAYYWQNKYEISNKCLQHKRCIRFNPITHMGFYL
jgi:hypothetical protein